MPEVDNGFEAKIHRLIQQAVTEKTVYERRKQETEKKLQEIDGELLAYEQTLDSYRKRHGKQTSEPTSITNTAIRQMTVGEGMETLIREAGGKMKIAALAHRLFEAGKLKNKRTANSHIRGVMHRDKRFVFIGDATVGLAEENVK